MTSQLGLTAQIVGTASGLRGWISPILVLASCTPTSYLLHLTGKLGPPPQSDFLATSSHMSSSDSKDLYADVLMLIGVPLVGFYATSLDMSMDLHHAMWHLLSPLRYLPVERCP